MVVDDGGEAAGEGRGNATRAKIRRKGKKGKEGRKKERKKRVRRAGETRELVGVSCRTSDVDGTNPKRTSTKTKQKRKKNLKKKQKKPNGKQLDGERKKKI